MVDRSRWSSLHTQHGSEPSRLKHVEHTRASFPGIRVIAHPECRWEVCELADEIGSTEYIRKTVTEAPAGSQWAIGTEIHMVQRLAKENPDRTVISLDDCACLCSTMYRISPQHLCWTLENLQEDQVVNQVQVDPETKHWARVALDRMLAMR